jgi:hypothetical protein
LSFSKIFERKKVKNLNIFFTSKLAHYQYFSYIYTIKSASYWQLITNIIVLILIIFVMSVFSPFFLRSNNGTGEVFFSVDGHTITEICLFPKKISMEQYPMEVKWLTIKSGIWAVKEVPAEQFEQAKLTFFQKAGVKVQIVTEPVAEKPAPPPTATTTTAVGSVSPSVMIAQAINILQGDDLPF